MGEITWMVFTDATADINVGDAAKYEIGVVPMAIRINDKEYTHYTDWRELPYDEARRLIGTVNPAQMGTTQANPDTFKAIWSPYLDEGKDIFHLSFSSGMSGTYGSAVVAARMLEEEYPGQTIRVLDSKTTCAAGLGRVVRKVADMRLNGSSLSEAFSRALDELDRYGIWFTVTDIDHLVRSGRCSNVAGFAIKALGIVPILYVDPEDGVLKPRKKARARKAMDAMFEEVQAPNIVGVREIHIIHFAGEDSAEYLRTLVCNRWEDAKVEIVHINPIVAKHVGLGTVGVGFPKR